MATKSKNNLYEIKIAYLILHQVFVIAMANCFYAYDYVLNRNPEGSEFWYLLVAIICIVIGIIFLIAYSRTESYLVKRYKKKPWIDTIYIEIVVLFSVGSFLALLLYLREMDVSDYTLPGLVITIGTLVYLVDGFLLIGYGSVYRRALRKNIRTDSFLYLCWQAISNYEKGKGLQELSRKAKEQARIKDALELMAEGHLEQQLDEEMFHGQEREMVVAVNHIQQGLQQAVADITRGERMRADLITNVSHDIKTPLTSIVNYVELLKREQLENENAKKYICVIEQKAQRLKRLTEDLVEASKISSGNIRLNMQTIDFLELLYQAGGEFNEQFEKSGLTVITKLGKKSVYVKADGEQLYRIIENLYTNVAKYAKENSRVYAELTEEDKKVIFTIRNISKNHIHIHKGSYMDLTERFVRGEFSRTTEGSGLGLSIAKNLVELMNGSFYVQVDGELFTVQITFPVVNSR